MYEAFYGLTAKPFQTNPDPAFYFDSRQHRRAMAYLDYGVHRNEGFIVITGEVGAGKTTVVRNLLSRLDRDLIVSAHLVSTQLDAENALRMVSSAFGLATGAMTKADLLIALEAFLGEAFREGKRCLLVIDEAQNLSMQAVEELRMLSNFQRDTHALLQSFLIGQPEFRHTLQSPQMTQLRQRVIAACHIGPLDQEDTKAYIEHRLRHAGWSSTPEFFPDAFPAIHKASGGIPRRINTVCDRLLLSGFFSDTRTFGEAQVLEVVREINQETFTPARTDNAVDTAAAQSLPDVGVLSATPRAIVDDLVTADFSLRVGQVEERLIRIEAAVDGLLRNNTAALMLLGRLVDHIAAPS